jgi:O-antigen/teichoic acid export membrane protein
MTHSNSEKRAILINAGSNGVAFAVTIIVTFLVTPFLVHGLGDTQYGIWLLIQSVLTYFTLGDMGIGAAVLRHVARFDGLRDHENINRIFSTSIAIFTLVGVLILPVVAWLAFGTSRPLGVDGDFAQHVRWYLIIVGISLALSFPLGVHASVLQGLRLYPIMNVIRIAGLLVRNALLVAVVYGGGGLFHVGLITAGSMLAQNTMYAIAAYRYLPTLRCRPQYIDLMTCRTIWGYSIHVFSAQTAGRLAHESAPILINAFLASTAITYYGIAGSLTSKASDALRQMIAVLTPTVSKWDGQGNYDAVRKLLITGTRCILELAIPIQLSLMFLGHSFLTLWMGPRYAALSYMTLVILAVPFPFSLAMAMANRILQGLGKVRFLSRLTWVQAILCVALMFVLVVPFGIEGVAGAIATSIALLSVGVSVLVCRVTDVSLGRLFRQAYLKPILISLPLLVFWTIVVQWSSLTTWTALIFVGASGLLMHGALLLAFEKPFRRVAVSMLLRMRITPSRLDLKTLSDS